MASKSPTARAKEYCKKQGWICQVVERWNPFAKVRQDLFGIIDIVALKVDKMVGIQATSRPNHAARVKKIIESPFLQAWLRTGANLEVWSFDGKKLKTKTGRRFKRTLFEFGAKETEEFEELI